MEPHDEAERDGGPRRRPPFARRWAIPIAVVAFLVVIGLALRQHHPSPRGAAPRASPERGPDAPPSPATPGAAIGAQAADAARKATASAQDVPFAPRRPVGPAEESIGAAAIAAQAAAANATRGAQPAGAPNAAPFGALPPGASPAIAPAIPPQTMQATTRGPFSNDTAKRAVGAKLP